MSQITITRPDDWHVHFRDHNALATTVKDTANHFSRALLMPNTTPPLTTLESLDAYKKRVLSFCPKDFTPFFTFYLIDDFDGGHFENLKPCDNILGAKLYPAGATTNSEQGIHSLKALYPLFALMEEKNLVLQVHGETTTDDIFYREQQFIEQELVPLCKNFPRLKIVLEHISTKAACDFVTSSSDNVAATITIHHLLYNRNDLLAGGIRPHLYCLPILKKVSDQKAVQAAALSGSPKFFLGTDSAPHTKKDKESACGCAGIYSSPYALALYAQFFDEFGALGRLEAFASIYGAEFYNLPKNQGAITLIKKTQTVANKIAFKDNFVKPIAAGEAISWQVHTESLSGKSLPPATQNFEGF